MTTTRRTLVATITPPGEGPPLHVESGFSGVMPVVGVPFTGFTLIGKGGVPPYSFSLASGALPPGLTLQPDGKVTGTPTTQGWYQFQARVTDSASQVSGPRVYAFTVSGGLKAPSLKLPPGVRAVAYSFQYRATDSSGSTAGITYAVQSGSLPPGLTISSSGLVSGIPTSQGYFNVTIRATKGSVYLDFVNRYQINWQFTTAGSVVSISDSLRNMVVGVPVRGKVQIDWPLATMPVGIGAYIWTIASGSLPAGLSLSTDGTIQGTPTSPTPYNYVQPTFAVTDKTGTTINVTLAGAQRLIVGAAVKATSPNRFLATDSDGAPVGVNFLALFFSSGVDGDAVLNGSNTYTWAQLLSGTYTLTRDVYLNNLTIASGISLNMNGFAIFGAGKADLTSASAASIYSSAGNGAPGTAVGGGAGGTAGLAGTLARGAAGGAGAAISTGSPPAGSVGGSLSFGYGGGLTPANEGGAGGTGTGGTPSNSGFSGSIQILTGYPFAFGPLNCPMGPIGGGVGGGGGGSGAGDGTNSGGSGGGGGAGAPVGMFSFYEIATGGSTPSGVFRLIAGNGGAGRSVSSANIGAGGGGLGGGGGYFHIRYAVRTGAQVADLVWSDGGNGGNGGTNSANAARNGGGGAGGHAGAIEIINVLTGEVTTYRQTTARVAPSGTTAGVGGRTRAPL